MPVSQAMAEVLPMLAAEQRQAGLSWYSLDWDVSFRRPVVARPERNRPASLGKKVGHPEERAVCRRPAGPSEVLASTFHEERLQEDDGDPCQGLAVGG